MKNYVATLVIAIVLASASAAQAQAITPPPVPVGLEVDAGNEAFLVGHAIGTQNYECQPVDSIGRVGWVLFTPQATLFDDLNQQLITHFFSPTPKDRIVRAAWQYSVDTSVVWGAVVAASTDANFVKAGAIAWLKIDVETTGFQNGPTGGNTLSKTTFIQRLNTDGGVAPSIGCDLPTDIGRKAFVPYTADYFFYKK
jgi:hypothetical protein